MANHDPAGRPAVNDGRLDANAGAEIAALAASTEPPTAPDTSFPSLICPDCGYNLTGLIENRCPECGEAFDPIALAREFDERPIPATPWEERPSVRSFFETWGRSHDGPRMMRGFIQRNRVAASWGYATICHLIGACLAVVPLLVRTPLKVEPILIALFFAFLVPGICELVMARGLSLLVPPRRKRHSFLYWLTLMHYTAGFFVVSCTSVVFWGICMHLGANSAAPLALTAIIIWFLWIAVLCCAIAEVARSAWRSWFAILFVLAVGAEAVHLPIAIMFGGLF